MGTSLNMSMSKCDDVYAIPFCWLYTDGKYFVTLEKMALMVWPQWLTARRIVTIAFIPILLLGIVGTAVFMHFGAVHGQNSDGNGGYIEVLNPGNAPLNVSIAIIDLQTENRIFEMELLLGTNGKKSHYSLDWPPMSSGEKRLEVVASEGQSGSYEFHAGDSGNGPNLSIVVMENEVDISIQSTGI